MRVGIDSKPKTCENPAAHKRRFLSFKPDWLTYLHNLRRREIEMIFGRCPTPCFVRGLELGAGDGFQSGMLVRYVASLVVTDVYPEILQRANTEAITHRVCDAEQVGDIFAAGEFDLVFSSNMLEHLPHPMRALLGMYRILHDDGLAVHVIPSPFWKLCQLIGFYPNAVVSRLERYTARWARAEGTIQPEQRNTNGITASEWDRNPKSEGRRYRYLRRLLWATPHGAASSNLEELRAFSPALWRRQFVEAGFTVAQTLRGPVSSGYGFGLDGLRDLLENWGLASEYVYVTHKTGHSSKNLAYIGAAT